MTSSNTPLPNKEGQGWVEAASSVTNHILFFGFGFSAQALARRLTGWKVTGTSRTKEGAASITTQGHAGLVFSEMTEIPAGITHIVTSIPPDADGDPVLRKFSAELATRAKDFRWVGYLSTTGVYGDHSGAWVDETTPLTPNTDRGHKRLAAETAWLRLHQEHGLPVHLFRLAGIYGPGRNALESVREGTAKRVIRKGQIFSRIHVEDIAGVLEASIKRLYPGQAYNVADDHPCPPQDVIAYACELLGVTPPPEIPFEQANLSPMARSFFMDSKRVSNARVKQELRYRFQFPDYRVGLRSLLT
jgi:nucleoside-diphosphate-sugar epimerase